MENLFLTCVIRVPFFIILLRPLADVSKTLPIFTP